ncbi:nuclear RNA export factor 1/2 [Kwoniella heveanensis BCC8398]|uniref:mRNA export factor MEX67 n=1 Tax=Kwoniella heveanensis BCC8398 TaxID=1296120 RepID=A0A1B9H4H3_9TREE|nr:nuclear RNA export factor 1/2 [Kwoniella heveanensis BCC8398]
MAAFQAALANFNNQQQNAPSASSSSSTGATVSIRGSANGAPNTRAAAMALRGAGITREQGMDVDGSSRGGGGRGRGAGRRTGGRSAGPLDQTGRHHPPNNANNKPYQKPPPPGSLASRLTSDGSPVSRGGGNRPARGGGPPGRNPTGTPPYLQQLKTMGNKNEREHSKSELNKKLSSDEMKNWIKNRMIAEGVMDMSGLPNDPWLKENGILPPGHPNAPLNAGTVFWRIIQEVIQKGAGVTIHTLSLANNDLDHLKQLERLPMNLPDIRALDLSGNPIKAFGELDNLRAAGEKKGKANAGAGSLKSLIELKLNNCLFRERTLQQPDGEQTYKHEILRRFPGLRILDGVSLERVIFPIERKPKARLTDEQKAALVAKPFTFPFDVQPGFGEEGVKDYAMQFCAKYFTLFDNDRNSIIPAYAPNALVSISCNTLPSRSLHQVEIQKTRSNRPQPVSFEAWTSLPSRNFFRGVTSVKQRMETLQTPADTERLLRWWNKAVPKTKHPLTDPTKWNFETWVLDGEGESTKLCLMIQGEFEEMPSGTYRSFSRTFILSPVPSGSAAQAAGWPAIVLSDTMVVHSYFGTYAFDESTRTLAAHGVTIQPPAIPPTTAVAAPIAGTGVPQDALIAQLSQRTGMNAQFSSMCLAQNGWDFEAAVKNFEEIRGTIPPEAFVQA